MRKCEPRSIAVLLLLRKTLSKRLSANAVNEETLSENVYQDIRERLLRGRGGGRQRGAARAATPQTRVAAAPWWAPGRRARGQDVQIAAVGGSVHAPRQAVWRS